MYLLNTLLFLIYYKRNNSFIPIEEAKHSIEEKQTYDLALKNRKKSGTSQQKHCSLLPPAVNMSNNPHVSTFTWGGGWTRKTLNILNSKDYLIYCKVKLPVWWFQTTSNSFDLWKIKYRNIIET